MILFFVALAVWPAIMVAYIITAAIWRSDEIVEQLERYEKTGELPDDPEWMTQWCPGWNDPYY